MPAARPAEILRQLAPPDATADADLLHSFAAARDHAAFAELVRRHGPLVLTVCRKVAGHPQDAEDAFQAVFLVLARKARTLAQPERLGNWLYGVAVRVSQRARRSASRRRAREVQVTAMPDPPSVQPEPTPDIGPVLHEELHQLPGWYRDAVLLCDLQGVSRTDAAKTLGIPEGTLSSRLATGRKKLAERLAKRGIVLAAAVVPSILGEGMAFAAVPDSLIRKTCGLVADWAVGGAVPAPVHTLLDGGFTVRKLLLLGLVVAAVTATGIAVMAQPKESAAPVPNPKIIAAADATPEANPVTAAAEEQDKKPVAVGAPRMRKAIDLPVARVDEFAWAPDGKGLVVRDGTRNRAAAGPGGGVAGPHNVLLYIPDVTAEPQFYYWQDLKSGETLVGFHPTGLAIITAIREYTLISGFHKLLVWSMPADKPPPDEKATLKFAHALELEPDQTYGYTFGPHGRTFRTVYRESKSPRLYSLLEVREVDARTGRTTKVQAKVQGEFVAYTLSADGTVLVTLDGTGNVVATDVDAGKQLWTAAVKEQPSFGSLSPAAQFGGGGGRGGDVEPRSLLVLSQNGQTLLVSRGGVHQPVVLNAKTGEPLPAPEGMGFVVLQPQSCRLSSDGKLLVLGGERAVERQRPKGGFGGPPPSFESGGNFVSVWDVATGKPIKSWSQEATVSFLPNSSVLAVFETTRGGTTRLGLWDFAADVPKK